MMPRSETLCNPCYFPICFFFQLHRSILPQQIYKSRRLSATMYLPRRCRENLFFLSFAICRLACCPDRSSYIDRSPAIVSKLMLRLHFITHPTTCVYQYWAIVYKLGAVES